MTRVFVILLFVACLAAPQRGYAQPRLHPSAVVSGDVVRLGDLFADAGRDAKDGVAPAPALGTQVTYSAAWLGAIAHEHHLDWKPGSDYDQATVERASRTIDSDLIGERLLKLIPSNDGGGAASIELDNPALRLLVPAEASDDIDVDGLTYDQHSGRFSAMVSAPPGSPDAQRVRVSGRLIVEMSVAVTNRNIGVNEIIRPDDVEQIKVPRARIAADTIVDPSQLIGKSARHVLRAEQPLRSGDVQDPLVVHKGDLVTVELRTAAMALSAQGKALDDGALGAAVHIVNTQSNRTIDATVIGPNLVRAAAAIPVASR